MDIWLIILFVAISVAVGFFGGYKYGFYKSVKAMSELYEAFGKMYTDLIDKEDFND